MVEILGLGKWSDALLTASHVLHNYSIKFNYKISSHLFRWRLNLANEFYIKSFQAPIWSNTKVKTSQICASISQDRTIFREALLEWPV